MQITRNDPGYDRLATLDIETTHYKPEQGETVSVGIGIHERGEPAENATYEPFHRNGDDEVELIERAFQRLDELDPDALVTFNGKHFDLDFLSKRLQLNRQENILTRVNALNTHIDLFEDRKAVCDRTGQKWPKLEECLVTYGFEEPRTIWGGRPVTNVRFGEELGPAYLEAACNGDGTRCQQLSEVIDHYLITDLEANLAIYYSDLGETFEPAYLGTKKSF